MFDEVHPYSFELLDRPFWIVSFIPQLNVLEEVEEEVFFPELRAYYKSNEISPLNSKSGFLKAPIDVNVLF